jgi:hypothetical protein
VADVERKPTSDGANVNAAVEYARNVHEETLDFNRELYLRAQIVLVLDGVVLGALGGALVSKPDDITEIVGRFSCLTWVFLALATLALLISVLSATGALYSRHRLASKSSESKWWFYDAIYRATRGTPGAADIFVKDVLKRAQVDPLFEAHVRLHQVIIAAETMVRRANRLNCAFLGTGVALGFFALAAVTYVILVKP